MNIILILIIVQCSFSQEIHRLNEDFKKGASEAVVVGPFIYVSGIVAYEKDQSVPHSAEEQTELIFQKIRDLLKKSKSSIKNIIKMTSYHTDMEEIEEFLHVKKEYMKSDLPTWSAIGVNSFMDRRMKVMIDIVAIKN